MDCPVFQPLVAVDHKLVRGEHESAVHALDAGGGRAAVQFRNKQTFTPPEALVVDFEAPFGALQLQGAQVLVAVRRVGAAVDQSVAEALRVRLGDQPAGGRGERQDAHHFEDLQLVRGAPGAVDVQVVAHGVDLLEREISQDAVEDLRQAQPLLPADHEAGDGLPLQHRLAPLRGAVGGDEKWPGHHRRGLSRQGQHDLRGFAIFSEERVLVPPSGERRGAAERAHGAEMKLLQSLLKSGMGLEAGALHVVLAGEGSSKLKMKGEIKLSERASASGGGEPSHVCRKASARLLSKASVEKLLQSQGASPQKYAQIKSPKVKSFGPTSAHRAASSAQCSCGFTHS